MRTLNIVNKQRQQLALITWAPPDQIRVETEEESIRQPLTAFVERAQQDGVPLRTGRQVDKEGKKIFIEERITVKPDDGRFLSALAEAISRASFGGQRLFALTVDYQVDLAQEITDKLVKYIQDTGVAQPESLLEPFRQIILASLEKASTR